MVQSQQQERFLSRDLQQACAEQGSLLQIERLAGLLFDQVLQLLSRLDWLKGQRKALAGINLLAGLTINRDEACAQALMAAYDLAHGLLERRHIQRTPEM
jgi:hypothetical protein